MLTPDGFMASLAAIHPGASWHEETTEAGTPYVAVTLPASDGTARSSCILFQDTWKGTKEDRVGVTMPSRTYAEFPTWGAAFTAVLDASTV